MLESSSPAALCLLLPVPDGKGRAWGAWGWGRGPDLCRTASDGQRSRRRSLPWGPPGGLGTVPSVGKPGRLKDMVVFPEVP